MVKEFLQPLIHKCLLGVDWSNYFQKMSGTPGQARIRLQQKEGKVKKAEEKKERRKLRREKASEPIIIQFPKHAPSWMRKTLVE